MKLNLTLDNKTNSNCYIHKLGYVYPILIWNRIHYNEAVSIIKNHPSFKDPAHRFHFTTYNGIGVDYRYRNSDIIERKWYAGNRRWGDRRINSRDFWLVFKTEKDRTLALMLLS